jgi:hypothetical protein
MSNAEKSGESSDTATARSVVLGQLFVFLMIG